MQRLFSGVASSVRIAASCIKPAPCTAGFQSSAVLLAVPKRKASLRVRRIRWAAHNAMAKNQPKGYRNCEFCLEPVRMHHICMNCETPYVSPKMRQPLVEAGEIFLPKSGRITKKFLENKGIEAQPPS
eukprot:TRINITY_DN278_c0_g1_i1.p2 TRINITY_DN278_c0_g1~~TRINITY_DN278_c0_g1_i1.p2  ORF type:complete len:128 (-),score=0.08 TRINITY_DN278_c0_g1_i1:336-719(-)